MPARLRHVDMGREDARRAVEEVARELRVARRSVGVSQAAAARRAGLSPSQYGRLERGEMRRATVDDLARAARAVGLRCSVRCYPSELRVQDTGQLAVLERFERLLAPTLRMRREVPLPLDRDLRAWDGRVTDGERSASIDAEARVGDLQALTRRTLLKQRDDPDAGVVILVLNRTAHNRAVLREHREALRADFPLDGATIAPHLRRGEVPPTGGIILV